jgi:outer membrane lipoprotein SlyB
MDNHHIKPHQRIHPLVATAAASVVLVSLVGVAAITGMLPSSNGSPAPQIAPSAYSQANTVPPVAYAQVGTQQQFSELAPAQSAALPPPSQFVPAAQGAPVAPRLAPAQLAPATPYAAPAAAYAGGTAGMSGQAVYAPMPAQTVAAHPDRVLVARADEPAVCHNCGTVVSVQAVEQPAARGSGVGAVAGALVGGLLGNQVGGGHGRQLATVAGAVGGSVAGNQIERNVKKTVSYHIRVRMQDGSYRTFTRAHANWAVGDHVRVVNGDLRARG